MLKSLKALHDGGFAHRNLKPSNILRRKSHNDWVLVDFACATILSAPPTLLAETNGSQPSQNCPCALMYGA